MTFNSFSYFLFLPVVYLLFYFSPDRCRWLVLLIASYGFYASFKAPYLLAVLLVTTGISYVCGLRIAAQQDEALQKRWLWIGCFACISLLALFKYLPFIESQTNCIFGFSSTISKTIISIGVSYFSFQAISYLADIYLEIEEPEHHFGRYALYMAFFPKLLQGPIERAGDLLPQLKYPYRFNYDAMRSGMLLFTWGLFKKVVVADRLALFTDQVYNNVHDYSGLSLILGTYAYALQIYFDFAGYTDMALGSAKLFNINLTQNFNSPYLATSVADFWRRWHITFSRWILDYIFKPLQMQWRNWGNWGVASALVVTFLISGIWHGVSWGFVIWGGLHGLYLASSVYYKPYQKKLHKVLGVEKTKLLKVWQVFVTFNLISFAWIFFRAASLGDAWYIVKNVFNFRESYVQIQFNGLSNYISSNIVMGFGRYECIKLALSLLILLVLHNKDHVMVFSKPIIQRWIIYCVLVTLICFLYVPDGKFIYFRF